MGMSEYTEITHRDIEIARIERDTDIPTPSFISELTPIDREKAAAFGIKHKIHPYVRPGEKQDFIDYWASKATLQYCRIRHQTLEQAESTIDTDPSYTTEELVGMFTPERYEAKRESLVLQEKLRREKRDSDIFKLEMALLNKRDIRLKSHPNSLSEYCDVLARETKKKHNKYEGEEIYWDLMEHYSGVINGAEQGFNPLEEWKQYLEGTLDITDMEAWDIQNVGDNDLSYYDMTRKWSAPRTRPNRIDYDSSLLFHTTTLEAANNIVRSGYLHPRVCYSAGQILYGRRAEVAFVFKKSDITDTYSALPYIESFGTHEREIRSNEQNSIDFCLGCVPVDKELFPDIYEEEGWYYPEHPAGRIASAQWEKNLQETGQIWNDEDRDRIHSVLKKRAQKTAEDT